MRFLIAILIFSILVLFHEFGHMLVAKKCHVKVNEFMIGLGPRLFGIKRGETDYSVHLLPLGGACVMEGEETDSDNPRAFNKRPAWQRLLIALAGPFFNLLMAFVLSIVLLSCIGIQKPVVEDVMEGYPASESGLMAGDQIIKMNHKNIHFYNEVSLYIAFHEGETIEVTFLRDNEKKTVQLTPKWSEEDNAYYMGVYISVVPEEQTVVNVIKNSFFEVEYWIWTTIESLKMLFTGGVSVNDMSGPVGIVKTIGDTYTESMADGGAYYAFLNMINITILLSANLAVMNLLPIPGLDGGRILFNIIEIVTRKQIPPDKEGMIHLVGMALLMALMIFIMFNDIRKLFLGQI